MKTNKILLVLFLAMSMVACKNDSNKTPENAASENVTNTVKFTLNAVVQQDDDFQIFYKDESVEEAAPFDEVNSVWSGVKGGTAPQDVIFNLPEDIFPSSIRVDFGHNKKQPEMTLNSFLVSFKDKSFEIKGADFFNYFTPDTTFVKVDAASGKVTPILLENGLYDPQFISTEKFNTELAKITQ